MNRKTLVAAFGRKLARRFVKRQTNDQRCVGLHCVSYVYPEVEGKIYVLIKLNRHLKADNYGNNKSLFIRSL